MSAETKKEVERRRAFAIISHPDAGKTTMTEKLLLYGGAIHEAGEVKAKRQRRSARSDWMKLEQDRGISISTSVMQFEYKNLRMNLLDTPGHADFSEDTYRTLAAADSAVMLLDNAKGVEKQTQKLFDVCRIRKTPIFTFINKLDREGRSGFELIDEIEKTLNIRCNPITWPIGCGDRFRGVYHRGTKKLILYSDSGYATKELEEAAILDVDDPKVKDHIPEDEWNEFKEEIELVDGGIGEWDKDAFLKGDETPVFFGSARTNFGVQPFLDFFVNWAPKPQIIGLAEGELDPTDDTFSGFVFKIQANMDKRHRDRIAFLRITSGKFKRGMTVHHSRLDRDLKLAYSQQFFAEERKSVEEAYAGDILGLHDTGNCLLGDTLYSGNKKIRFRGIPQFSPENFAKLLLRDPMKRKQLSKGVKQLCEEGTIQYFTDPRVGDQDPIIGAVGMLQFDVLLYRLKDEYGVEVTLQSQPFTVARWAEAKDGGRDIGEVTGSCLKVEDRLGNPVLLFTNEFNMNWVRDNNANIVLREAMIDDK